jgi:hypothetical protein
MDLAVWVVLFVVAAAALFAVGTVAARRNELISTVAMRWTLGFLIAGPVSATVVIMIGLAVEQNGSTVAFGFASLGAAVASIVVCGIASAVIMLVGLITQNARRRRARRSPFSLPNR